MAIHQVNHPLVQHKLAQLRRQDLLSADFRRISNEIAQILMVSACAQLPLTHTQVIGWQGKAIEVKTLTKPGPTLVPILRAGLGMLTGCLSVLPNASTSVVGLYRDENTLAPVAYFDKVVSNISQRTAIIIDPMLATAGTALATIELLKAKGCQDIKALFLVAAPEGIQRVETVHPDVECWIAGIDDGLNEKGYILPGLGDAGDRIFGTQ